MMQRTFSVSFLLLAVFNVHQIYAAPKELTALNKVFNYQGSLPIKDDRTGEVIKNQDNQTEVTTELPFDQAQAEAACWMLINERSGKCRLPVTNEGRH